MTKYLLISLMTLSIYACSSTPETADGVPTISISEYESLVEEKTKNVESYDGLSNQLNVSATKIDTKMADALLARSSQIYEWNRTIFQEEKAKSDAALNTKTEFFMSFYTPERSNNNLTSTKPIWKIYLDVGGKRYEGKVSKIKSQLADLQALYPYHNRFSSAYKVEFPIATSMTENQPEVLTITGPSAAVKLKY